MNIEGRASWTPTAQFGLLNANEGIEKLKDNV